MKKIFCSHSGACCSSPVRVYNFRTRAVEPHQSYLYYGGPEFQSGIATTTALYKTTGTIAAVRGTYTSGRYILFGVHPEVLSDSGLVSTDTGRNWLNREFIWARNGSTQPVLVYVQSGETWDVSRFGN